MKNCKGVRSTDFNLWFQGKVSISVGVPGGPLGFMRLIRVGILQKVDKFYYLVDFVVLDTEPIASGPNHVPIILGRPFLATVNAFINCRNGVMQLTFGNMTLELNIFHLSNKHKQLENDNQGTDEVCSIDQNAEKPNVHKLQGLDKENETIGGGLNVAVIYTESIISPKSPCEKKINKNGPSIKAVAEAMISAQKVLF